MTCLECGAESAEETGVCARCGAPIGLQEPMDEAPALGLPSTWVAQAGPSHSRRRVLVAVGVVVGVLAALAALVAVIVAKSSSGASQLTWDQLQPGDCLASSNMGLGKSTPWPDTVTRVACTQRHEAEVFFAGNVWPQSTAYPGDTAVDDQARARCGTAFAAYDGVDDSVSAFTFDDIVPDSSAWASGQRSVACVAFAPSSAGPSGGAPVDYSIKGSKR